jgi:hypothetical protein
VKEILKEKKVNAMLRELWEAEGVKESVKKIVIKQYVNLMERKRVMEKLIEKYEKKYKGKVNGVGAFLKDIFGIHRNFSNPELSITPYGIHFFLTPEDMEAISNYIYGNEKKAKEELFVDHREEKKKGEKNKSIILGFASSFSHYGAIYKRSKIPEALGVISFGLKDYFVPAFEVMVHEQQHIKDFAREDIIKGVTRLSSYAKILMGKAKKVPFSKKIGEMVLKDIKRYLHTEISAHFAELDVENENWERLYVPRIKNFAAIFEVPSHNNAKLRKEFEEFVMEYNRILRDVRSINNTLIGILTKYPKRVRPRIKNLLLHYISLYEVSTLAEKLKKLKTLYEAREEVKDILLGGE